MSLSSSLFSGISGLNTLGNAMQIIGDNIANVNTVGFKGSSFSFQDLLSQTVATLSGTSQVGRGTALGDITASFQQGSFESTSNATDMGIGGQGFFVLKEAGTLNNFYSRAGNFSFDQNGYLTNPEGYIVQGWALDSSGNDSGSITDIVMNSFTSPPLATSNIQVIVNLDSDGTDNSSGSDDALAGQWDATQTEPIAETAYDYLTSLRVYDSLGETHDVTIYFDKAQTPSSYEFIVTSNPDEDFRTFADTYQTSTVTCGAAATLTTGDYFNISSPTTDYYVWYNIDGGGGDPGVSGKTAIPVAILGTDTASDVATKTAAAINALGDFSAPAPAAAVVTITNSAVGSVANSSDMNTDFTIATTVHGDLAANPARKGLLARGLINFDVSGSMTDIDVWKTNPIDGTESLQTETSDLSNGYFTFDTIFFSGAATQSIELDFGTRYNGSTWANSSLSTSQYATPSTTTFQSADGYGAGDFQGVTVDVDGVITGSYSNGQLIPLYRVGLAKFQNDQGLFKEGRNLFSETRKSGNAITNRPGTNGLGSIAPNALEQSNVDIATELVKMITTQRGFQANSKIIMVTDQMLSEIINIKR